MANKTIDVNGTTWTGTSKQDNVFIDADYVSVNTGAGNDSIKNRYIYAWYSTINAGDGNDTIIFEESRQSSINAGAGNDKISLSGGYYLTISGGKGNDTVYAAANYNLYQYASGDGNDVIYNWGAGDTISITGAKYTKKTSGSDVILTVGSGKITLVGAKDKAFTVKGTLAGGGKNINNTKSKKTITGMSYADTIKNSANYVTINAGAGNDKIYNTNGAHSSINAGDGNDSIHHISYDKKGHYITIIGGAGKDSISNEYGDYSSINAGNGADSVYNKSYYTTINGGADNDTITNFNGALSSINGGAGNDLIINEGNVDYASTQITIKGGTGNDSISLSGAVSNTVIEYASGDGYDIVYGFGEDDTLKITGAKYTKKNSGSDVILTVGTGKITLKGAKGKTLNIDGTLDGKLSIPSAAYTYNGHSYYIYSGVAKTWNEAKTYCEARGGHLAVINNAKENTKLFNYMKSKGYDSAYFGLSDAAKEGTWTWVTGEKVSYKNFASGEPNGGTYENYGMFYNVYKNGEWNDGDFGSEGINAFICEWDTVTPGGGSTSTVQPAPTVPSGDIIKGTNGHDNLANGNNLNPKQNAGKVIYAYDGNDTITNYANNVYISGGTGNDYIKSNWGSNSTVHGGAGNDNITVQSSNAFVYGEDGNDRIWAYNEGNFIYGGKGDDYIRTENNNNGFVSGEAGDDTITAYKGTHLTLSGGAGNDSLWGGENSDTLIGGAGDDIFVYKPGEGTDHITDFSGSDMLKILKTNGREGGTFTKATFSGGNLTLAISDGGTVILDNVKAGQSININGTIRTISGKTLK
ncbi:MAG: hypothetical protein IKO74_01300 [Selenomonadaceae bacterium]|nr:hypothetical protein [Selenomonadaceae bacterium]